MGRPERPLDLQAGPIAELAGQLRELREQAGRPSYAVLARRAHLSQTTLSEAAGGQRLPTWDTTAAYVRACGGDPLTWRQRWDAAAVQAPSPTGAEPDPITASTRELDARTGESGDTDRSGAEPPWTRSAKARRRWWVLGVAAAVVASGVAFWTVGQRTAGPQVVVADGADPKDSGCALDPAVVTLDSAEVDLGGGPVGLDELRYSPRCGVAWARFTPFPKAVIPTTVVVHVDVVRPATNNQRLPFHATYVGAPVYGNVMNSTEECVYAAVTIDQGPTPMPESRTHCFRGATPLG